MAEARRHLTCLRLDLRADEATVFPADPAVALHAALHRLLATVDPDLARRIHDAPAKPLTLSPLYRAAGGEIVGRSLAAGERVWARVGLLDGATRAAFDAALAAETGSPPLNLDGRAFAVETVAEVAPPGAAQPAPAGYAALAAAAAVAPELTLRFGSPTAFRNKGYDLLRPEPRLVFGSLLRRWQAFAPPGLLAVDEAAFDRAVALIDARVTVRAVDLGRRRQPGFVGWARYRLTGDEALAHAIAALADYAAYAGVGARTAFGMGQTHRLK